MLTCDTKSQISGKERTSRWRARPNQGYPKLERGIVYAHLCFNEFCSESTHIEVMSQSDNLLAADVFRTGSKSFYSCGHERSKDNTYSSNGLGNCRRCNLNIQRRNRNASRRSS